MALSKQIAQHSKLSMAHYFVIYLTNTYINSGLEQAPEQAQTKTSAYHARSAPRSETFEDALARARRQQMIATVTLGTHAEETRLRSSLNELVQFVTRQHELEKDDTNDDESIISASNPQN